MDSLRRFRDDVREVAANFECGIGLSGYNDLVEGDILECYTNQARSRAGS
jgi:translation initiation factor IF-2